IVVLLVVGVVELPGGLGSIDGLPVELVPVEPMPSVPVFVAAPPVRPPPSGAPGVPLGGWGAPPTEATSAGARRVGPAFTMMVPDPSASVRPPRGAGGRWHCP